MSVLPPHRYLSLEEPPPVSPFRLALAVAVCTLTVEFVIMEFLPKWDRGLSPVLTSIADAAMLCLMITPVLYVAIYKPLRATIDKLERALGHLRLTGEVVERTAEAIIITDASAKILYVNKSFSEITGYSAMEAVGKPTSMLKSGLHDKDFYTDLWTSILTTGAWQGEIWNKKKDGEIYLEYLSITRVQPEATKAANFVAIFTQANYDRLTGLANRHLFLSKLATALHDSARRNEPVAVLFIDLDGFKAVNDVSGHDHGDRLLQSVGRALRKSMRASDLAARLGGDEFVVLVQGPRSREDALQIGEKIRMMIKDLAGRVSEWTDVSASIGVAVAESADRAEPLALLRAADQAMYLAKRQGKDRLAVGAYIPSPAHE